MKTDARQFALSKISIAIRGALFAAICGAPLLASAQAEAPSDEVRALIYPTSWFDIGVIALDDSSTKFGEYNGLNNSGPYIYANFDLRGGDAYGTGDGTTRVEATGTDLGTNSRALGLKIADQGLWTFGAGYDQLRHYTTDGFETPLQGNLGSNIFTLLPSFGVINTTTTVTNGVITSPSKGAQTLTSNQLAQFHGVDVYSE